jgi:hypothetical protein
MDVLIHHISAEEKDGKKIVGLQIVSVPYIIKIEKTGRRAVVFRWPKVFLN